MLFSATATAGVKTSRRMHKLHMHRRRTYSRPKVQLHFMTSVKSLHPVTRIVEGGMSHDMLIASGGCCTLGIHDGFSAAGQFRIRTRRFEERRRRDRLNVRILTLWVWGGGAMEVCICARWLPYFIDKMR